MQKRSQCSHSSTLPAADCAQKLLPGVAGILGETPPEIKVGRHSADPEPDQSQGADSAGPHHDIIAVRAGDRLLQILASPGSGKTGMLVWRELYDLCMGDTPSDAVRVTTFTRRLGCNPGGPPRVIDRLLACPQLVALFRATWETKWPWPSSQMERVAFLLGVLNQQVETWFPRCGDTGDANGIELQHGPAGLTEDLNKLQQRWFGSYLDNASIDDPEVEAFEEDAVLLLTFHQSKGLELDHVYVAGTGRAVDVSTALRTKLFSGEAVNYAVDPATGAVTCKDKEVNRLALADREREVYVALTRAKTHLTVLFDPSHEYEFLTLNSEIEKLFAGPP